MFNNINRFRSVCVEKFVIFRALASHPQTKVPERQRIPAIQHAKNTLNSYGKLLLTRLTSNSHEIARRNRCPQNALLVAAAGAALAYPCVSLAQRQSSSTDKKLQVIIIAVSEFEDPAWHNARVKESIRSAADELESFFSKRFPNAQLHILRTKDETTSDSIRALLRQLRTFGSNTITLLFILSHGEQLALPNPAYSQDLMIITSDTRSQDPEARAIRAKRDLITSFQELARGSLVFAFIDTCHSGAIGSALLQFENTLVDQLSAVKMNVVTSALPENRSFRAMFTKALLEIWRRNGNCTSPYSTPQRLREAIRSMLASEGQTLRETEGHVSVPIPFKGNFCLESFGTDRALIAFYNASSTNYIASIRPIEQDKQYRALQTALLPKDVTATNLERGIYDIRVLEPIEGNQVGDAKQIDLARQPVQIFPVATTEDPKELGAAYERFAGYAEMAGMSGNIVQEFRLTALAHFERAGDTQSIARIRVSLGEFGEPYVTVEEVAVMGEADLIDRSGATISHLLDETTIAELPLDGRDLNQLAILQPGVARVGASAFSNPWQNTTNGRFSVNGMRPTTNSSILDGTPVNDPQYNQTGGGPSGSILGADTIKEFRILTNMYSAEYGQNAGAVVRLVTKSGTNTFHGSLFEYTRNESLNARNFFDRTDTPIPLLRHNQFGATLGGPISRDRTFFFLGYEGLRERKSETQSFLTPTAAVRNGAAPEIARYLTLYPLPNDPTNLDLRDGTGLHKTSDVRKTTEDQFKINANLSLTDVDSLKVNYVFDAGDSYKPFMSTSVPGFDGLVTSRNQSFVFSETHVFTPNLLYELRGSFNRTGYSQDPAAVHPGLSISLAPGERPTGHISVGGLPPIGHALTVPADQHANTFQLLNQLTYTAGRHDFTSGFSIRRFHVNGQSDFAANGSYSFLSMADFIAGNVGLFLGTSPTSADSNRGYRQTNLSAFLQDEYTMGPNLTLNMGVRYEYDSSPSEQHGRLANIRDPLNDIATTQGKLFGSPTILLAPRFGFAWSPFGNGRTVIRSGIGLFHDFIKQGIYNSTRWLPPFYEVVIGGFGPGTFRNLTTISPIGISMPIAFNISQTYTLSYNFQIQREVTPDMVLSVSYIGSRGNHLTRSGEVNPTQSTVVNNRQFFPDRFGPRLNEHFGSILQVVTDAQSFYNSLQFSLARRLNQGLSFQAAYTLGKSIDDASGPLLSDFMSEIGPVQDFYDRKNNRALSAFDTRHNFVFSVLYELPFGSGKKYGSQLHGLANHLVEGWQISGILSLNSGFPFTVRHANNRSRNGAIFHADRPNLKPHSSCRILGDPDRWFDASVFEPSAAGFYGTAGRNICRGPNFGNFDLLMFKDFQITDEIKMQFRAEFYNLTNHPNFGPPVNTDNPYGQGGNGNAVFIGNTSPAGVGRIFRTVNDSRQVQFALKLIF